MPTELHSGHAGPSMVLLFICGEEGALYIRIDVIQTYTVFMKLVKVTKGPSRLTL